MAAVVVLAGCGGGDKPEPQPQAAAPNPAASAEEFADRFEKLTSLRLRLARDTFGTRMDEPDDDALGYRISGYSYYWTGDESDREVLLDGRPGPDGTLWDRAGDGWAVAKAYGPRLVLDWVGADSRAVTPEWERLDRLTEAAYTGDLSVLEPAERPCTRDPLHGGTETCSVDGIPVTPVDGDEALVTPVVEARVTGMRTTETVGTQTATGTFVVIGFRLANAGDRPIRYLRTALRIGDETFAEAAGASVFLPRTGIMPLPPGQETEQQVAFDVPPDLAARVRRDGALVLPADADALGDPNIEFAQGWIRLSSVPSPLPEPPAPSRPEPPAPEGPPDVPLVRGDGPPIGGTARRLYTANSFIPMPDDFVPGGVNVGNRAGGCVVPRIDRRTRARLLAAVRRDTPRADGRVARLTDRQILLAGCGVQGRWAIVAWVAKGGSRGPVIFVDEFEHRHGAWQGSPKGRFPGCGIPPAAAAAWQIDVSHCTRDGSVAQGEQS